MGWCFLSLHPVPPWSSLLGNCSIHRSCLFNRTLQGSGVSPGPHEDLSKSNTQYQNCLSNLALDQSHWSQRGLFESISRNSVLDRKKVLTQPLNKSLGRAHLVPRTTPALAKWQPRRQTRLSLIKWVEKEIRSLHSWSSWKSRNQSDVTGQTTIRDGRAQA